ncbi:arginine--tRNA ligase [Bacteroidia bacterium]|nr:arginine--tRNA ligase [Bacteroidia bacterium]
MELFLFQKLQQAVLALYNLQVEYSVLPLQKTRKDFAGDYTLVTFPLTKVVHNSPENIAAALGKWLANNVPEIAAFNVVKGFLNIEFTADFWLQRLECFTKDKNFGTLPATGKTVMVEYSSPNTNKPLHLGHIRNNLLGYSVAQILQAAGNKVIKVNLVNDRGIHICKSMLAWQKWGNGETPQSSGTKGDHLVGNYYVRFDQEYKQQIAEQVAQGKREDEAKKQSPIILEAQTMLQKWEQGDAEVKQLWSTMNGWVYDGFAATYKALGVDFDKTYYESNTYLLGKGLVAEGLQKGVFFERDDSSVWIDLTADGLDQKLVQRSDGTSVYITQDIGTAVQRFGEHQLNAHIYVVGNEQNYHFQVLKLILAKLGYAWADSIQHLSYGMVELPEGKMKSREGTVVDADDLVQQMFDTAREMADELGKLEGLSDDDKHQVIRTVGLGALKYYILKVDPQKTMLFNPKESIDFNGNTGPFIQYTHARIRSVLRRAADEHLLAEVQRNVPLSAKEISLIKMLDEFSVILQQAATALSPALIANYTYELTKEFNQFYHDFSILKEDNLALKQFRLALSSQIALTINKAMSLLGIDVPERM